ncbi:MAG: efflux RND transporter permease subunit, partial [Acidimicrobiia bacterium]|nr:efflux RND transporter permease subunit [Acidimicrobiia bacterium]
MVDLGVLARWNIKPRLLGVPGVANVAVWGHRDRQLQVLVDPASLNDAGVTLDEVVKTTGEALWVSPLTYLESSKPGTGGWIDTPNQRLGIRHLLPIASPEDLGKVPVVNHPDLVIADIAEVAEGHQQLIGDALIDGEPGMILVIERFPDADPVAVTEEVESTLGLMRAGLPGVDVDTELFRPAGYVESMATNLTVALGVGLLLALIALALFARSWRTAVISLVAILTSLSVALLVLDFRGATLNVMTIGGLLIALAVIVDEVIVDTNTVTRRLQAARESGEVGSSRSVIFFAAAETRRAILTAAALLVLVVVPVLFLPGLTGDLFSPLATSYIIAILAAFVVALVVTPGLTSLLVKDIADTPQAPSLPDRVMSTVDRIIDSARRVSVTALLGIAVVLAVASVATILLMNRSWTPNFQQDTAHVQWEAEPGTSPAVMLDTIQSATDELNAIEGVLGVSAHIGRAETGDRAVNVNSADIWVRFDSNDREATVDAIAEVGAGLPGSSTVAQTFIPERLDEALNGPDSDLTVRVYGVDIDEIDAKAREIAEVVDVVDGVSEASVDDMILEPQLNVSVGLEQAEQYGILPGDVRRQATTLISGLQVGSLFEEQKVFDVVVWGVPGLRDETADFEGLLIDLPDGSQVALSELATIETVDAPLNIRRDAVSRFADVAVQVEGRSSAAVADDIESALQEVTFAQEYRAEITGPAIGGQAGRWR